MAGQEEPSLLDRLNELFPDPGEVLGQSDPLGEMVQEQMKRQEYRDGLFQFVPGDPREKMFMRDFLDYASRNDISNNPDEMEHNYDYRKAWLSGVDFSGEGLDDEFVIDPIPGYHTDDELSFDEMMRREMTAGRFRDPTELPTGDLSADMLGRFGAGEEETEELPPVQQGPSYYYGADGLPAGYGSTRGGSLRPTNPSLAKRGFFVLPNVVIPEGKIPMGSQQARKLLREQRIKSRLENRAVLKQRPKPVPAQDDPPHSHRIATPPSTQDRDLPRRVR